ncbi:MULTISPECIES: MBL fold metallo-hydrolase [Halomonas]|uniref:Glyoxylase-like metal-dependent hydrolase (Beta-lactamase superfamily II) n=1 Tax=Halomonas ventosae TaxID=229007 RepID=A0A4R6GRS6_9GAMM|nr:MBL fold metallo-hydrolase [Halomonas ventosae]TDN97837.1 glyoxylase-like metal-dependent hydrolase (beta-lactamase superfamily II) [Halomonas ventosae]
MTEIRPAATLALVRDGHRGLEVLLLQRTWQAAFLPGYFVFPGGAVDLQDPDVRALVSGQDDATISQTLSLDEGGADYMIAALRECLEEAGLLLAVDSQGRLPAGDHPVLTAGREALRRSDTSFRALCEQHGLVLPLDRLAYLGHWVTPRGAPRRFDTRFFVALAPPDQQAAHDGCETIDHAWLPPVEAVAAHRQGRMALGYPTLRTLRLLADFSTTEALLRHAHANPPTPRPSRPWPARKGGTAWQVEPDSPAYAEVRRLDPHRQGTARAELVPGRVVQLAPGVTRITAPNAGVMTGPGTNSYLLGDGHDHLVIDPGPAEPAHLERLLALCGGRLSRVLVTHTHIDHSPGAAWLKARTGARLVGLPPPLGDSQDASFEPDYRPHHGERLATPAGPLKVLHTPGHASNHLCYLLEPAWLLFAGDQVMQGSTVVINPPDGDMAAYLEVLDALGEEPFDTIAPGHGFLIGEAHAAIDYLMTHRLAREHKVRRALARHGPAPLEALTPHAYDDVPAEKLRVATRSALAHLLKLETEGRAEQQAGLWVSRED